MNVAHHADAVLCVLWREHAELRSDVMNELYRRHAQRLYIYCRKMTGGEHEASDLFQDAWLKILQVLERKDVVPDHVGAYLLRIARNQILNAKRSDVRHVTLEDVELLMRDRPYEQREALVLLDRALELLDPVLREAFVLYEMEGLTYDEMMTITGETMSTLKTRVWRARTRLREILRPVLGDVRGMFGHDDAPTPITKAKNDDETT